MHALNNEQQYDHLFRDQRQIPRRDSSLDSAAMTLGIVSIGISFLMPVFLPLILGTIGIIVALISRGYQPHLSRSARTGLTCSIIGIVGNIIFAIVIFFSAINLLRSGEMRDEMNRISSQMYGYSMDELLESSFGYDMEDLLNQFGLTGEEN